MLEIKHATTDVVLLTLEGDTWEGRNFTGAALDGARFAKLQMPHTCLRGASLRRADFSGAILQEACFDGANLERALLVNADLTTAKMLAAIVSRADLRGAVLRYAKLAGASFEGANLQGADLSMSDARANFRHARLVSCSFRGANLAGANLQNADLTNADFTDANMAGAILIGATLTGAKMPSLGETRVPAAIASPPERPASPSGTRSRSKSSEPSSKPRKGESQWMTVTGPDFDSVRVNCPECGFATRVDTQQLEGSYRCRACQNVFKLDKTGKPKTGRAKGKKPQQVSWEPRREPSKLVGRLVQGGILLVALAISAVLITLGVRTWQDSNVPSTLPDRALAVAEAFIANEADRVMQFAPAESRHVAEQWLARRPSRWSNLPADAKHRVRVKDTKQGAASASVMLELAVIPPGQSASPSAGLPQTPDTMDLTTVWNLASDGNWLLDMPNTIGHLPPPSTLAKP